MIFVVNSQHRNGHFCDNFPQKWQFRLEIGKLKFVGIQPSHVQIIWKTSYGISYTPISVQYTVEYILRLWSCGCHGRFKGYAGRLKFARRFFSILGESRILKLLKLLKKLVRSSRSWKIFGDFNTENFPISIVTFRREWKFSRFRLSNFSFIPNFPFQLHV